MKYSIVTFGCRVNQADSLRLEEDLRARFATESASTEADLVIVNTCSVTATADQGARQTIRRIARENPRAQIIATGCYATRCPDDLASLPGVARVVPNDDKLKFVGRVFGPGGLRAGAVRTTANRDGDGPCGAPIEPGVAGRTAFTLRVQTGCEERCAYCIIPSTRGRSRSTPPSEIVRRVNDAVAAGYREVALTGVHLGSYGRDLPTPSTLTDLLRTLDQQTGDVLFRISSLEPMDCTPAIVDVIARSARFAPHVHLPLQH